MEPEMEYVSPFFLGFRKEAKYEMQIGSLGNFSMWLRETVVLDIQPAPLI